MIESEVLQDQRLSHGFFTRGGGHSTGIFASLNCGFGSGDDPEVVVMNRGVVERALGVSDGHLVSAFQVHSADVVTVEKPWAVDARPKVDGLVTKTRGLAIGILTADCGPVLFADAEAGVVGACHAGWKGALTGVTDSTIAAMEQLGSKREQIVAVLGPTISKTAYEVGPEFPAPFLEQDAQHARFFSASVKAGHFMFDLPAYLMQRLRNAGLKAVHDLALCTYSDEARFYSYRRATHRGEKDYGRLVSAIALKA
jgi:polyphenol oxidase